MKELLFQLVIFFTLFVLIASTQAKVKNLVLENELIFDLASESSDEWIIETEPNHIFYFSFLTIDDVDHQQISTSLTIVDVNNPDSLLFPSETNKLSPFYSTGNAVSIKFESSSSTLNPFRLRVEKAVPCPFNIGGSSNCARVVDELSCYCALYAARTWEDTKSYCQSYNMSFLSIESYEEDLAVFNAFAGLEILWMGVSDNAKEGLWIWDSTGDRMSPGYQGWAPGRPYSSCQDSSADCAAYNISSSLPAWGDVSCTVSYGGICELQPSNLIRSTQSVKLDLEKELIIDLSGSSDEWIITTHPNHIFYFSFLTNDDDTIDEQQKEEIRSSLTIVDVNDPDSLLFPSNFNQLSPFYSTGNTVSIKLSKPSITSSLNGFRLKAQKAVPCPLNLGGSSSCGRVVDEVSCYCALYASITWSNMKDFCKTNKFNFVSIESYEEDVALYSAFGGSGIMWIGASDTASEGTWVWDSTGKPMSPGYMAWAPGRPYSSCGTSYDCAIYSYTDIITLSEWFDVPCSSSAGGGICELQP